MNSSNMNYFNFTFSVHPDASEPLIEKIWIGRAAQEREEEREKRERRERALRRKFERKEVVT